MSTREILYSMIDNLTEQQMQGLIMLLNQNDVKEAEVKKSKSLRGIFSDCADPNLIPLEEGAWERAAVEKHENA